MREEVKKFYQEKKIPIGLLVSKRPVNINEGQVLKAAESLYDEIIGGLQIKDISLARRLWGLAKKENAGEFNTLNTEFERFKKMMVTTEQNLKYAIWGGSISFFLFIGMVIYEVLK